MVYQVQKGDTIAKVKDLMNISWDTLRRLNPEALGQSSRSGRWFLRQGAVLRGKEDFEPVLMREKGVQESASEPPAAPVSGEWSEYTIQEGDTLWGLAVKRFHVNVKDLIRDNGIDDPRRLRPGQKIRVRIPSYPEQTEVVASWYGENHHGRPMANGDFFNMYGDTVAHKKLPFGTRVELENPETGEKVNATVTDRGPYVDGRDVDLSFGLARRLSLLDKGVGKLLMRVLG